MADQTPERARKLARRWSAAATALIAAVIPAYLLGFKALELPLNLLALVCMFAAGEKSGWADGWKAAKADKSPGQPVSSCENSAPDAERSRP